MLILIDLIAVYTTSETCVLDKDLYYIVCYGAPFR